jgi:hypothetical protein
MILTIIGSAFYTILNEFIRRTQGTMDPAHIALGAVALAVGLVAVMIAFYFLFLQARRGPVKEKKKKEEEKEETPAPEPSKPITMKELLSFQKTVEGVKKGRHTLTTMLTYILIAEFGVFSSVTVSAPSVQVGVGLFIAFFVGVSVYIFRTYSKPMESLKMLLVASICGFLLSLVLGVVWDPELTWQIVLSEKYFTEPTLVAFLTGIALSLFMAGKESQD